MEQNYSLMAQSRANYYTAGSPVQFVRVELLKGDETGEVAVCLSFKNVGTETVTGMVIHFKCKDASGQILCEDDFYYEQLNAQPGEIFGSDDAVYVSDTPVSSVEIEQDRAFLNGRGVDLRSYKRVRLPMPRVLPGSIAKMLQTRTNNSMLVCVPQDIEQGWFCSCGAFHPNEENVTVCSECGADRTYIKVTLTKILEEARQAAEKQQREINAVANPLPPQPVASQNNSDWGKSAQSVQQAIQQSRVAATAKEELYGQQDAEYERTAQYQAVKAPSASSAKQIEKEEGVRQYKPKGRLFDDDEQDDRNTQMFDSEEYDSFDYEEDKRGRYAEEEEETEDDALADRIIRWAPPITAIVCALIIAVSLIYRFVIV